MSTMTRKELGRLLREEELRRLEEMSPEELICERNTCEDCGGQILDDAELDIIIRRASDLTEFYELFEAARNMDEGDGHN
jgi:hypothetical protein